MSNKGLIKLGNVKVRFERAGNASVTMVFNKDRRFISVGKAVCSEKDTPSKEKGRRISLTRALEYSELTKEQRAEVWEDYRTMTKTPRWSKNNQ